MSDARVRCSFYIRTPVEGGFRYDPVEIRSPWGSSYLVTPHPPAVGDRVSLPVGMFVVVARQWMHSAWGSVDWPYGETEPKTGPMLDILVEHAEGLFVNEVYTPDDDEDDDAPVVSPGEQP